MYIRTIMQHTEYFNWPAYLGLRLQLQQTKKVMARNECTSVAGHSDGHADALKQGTLMQQIQGHTSTRCPWKPPSGDYSLRIALAAARATGTNKWRYKNTPTLLSVLMAMAMRQNVTMHIAWWRRTSALLEATEHHHPVSCCSSIIRYGASLGGSKTCKHNILRVFLVSDYKYLKWLLVLTGRQLLALMSAHFLLSFVRA